MPLPVNYDEYRPKVCAFYAGRVWYAGIPSPEKASWVMFSQVLDDISNVEKCHQRNDPTSEIISDLLDSDGGIIVIPDAGDIISLVPMGASLFIFGSQGVWQIIGGQNGFTAAEYSVQKVTDAGCAYPRSIVVVENNILYWGYHGIYSLTIDASGLGAASQNISDQKIKSFYNSIPAASKTYVSGAYNNNSKIVHWLYNDATDLAAEPSLYSKNRVLALDIRLNSYYTFTIDQSVGPIVVDVGTTKDKVETIVEDLVYESNNQVVEDVNNVVVLIPSLTSVEKQFKYLTFVDLASPYTGEVGIAFADYDHTYFEDWYLYDNAGFTMPAHILTGYSMAENGPARAKTAGYIHMFMKKTETYVDSNGDPDFPSSCLMTTRWDFTDNAYPGKWSDQYEVYRKPRPYMISYPAADDDGYPLVISKNKVRGRGKALQLKLESNASNDMQIVGWSITYVQNTNV